MADTKDQSMIARREFLVAAGSVAVGAAVLAPQKAEASADEQQKRKSSKGYQLSEHVQKYYDLSRF